MGRIGIITPFLFFPWQVVEQEEEGIKSSSKCLPSPDKTIVVSEEKKLLDCSGNLSAF